MNPRFRTARAVCLMLLAALPAAVYAQYSFTNSSDTLTLTGYSGSGGDVLLPATLEGLPVTAVGDGVFSACTNLASVTFPGGVTRIGDSAFLGCTRLTRVVFLGNAPDLGLSVFAGADQATVYYAPGATGWGALFGGRPTDQCPLVAKRSPASAPAAVSEGASVVFSLTAGDATDPLATRGMSNVTWYVDGVRKLETKTGAPGTIVSAFSLKTDASTVQGAAFRELEVRAVALDRRGGAAGTNWTLRVNNLPAAQTIAFPALTPKALGDPDFAPGARASSGLPVLYTSSNESVAQVVDGMIRLVGAGTALIAAGQQGSEDYKAATPVRQTLTVKALLAAEIPDGGGAVTGAGLYTLGAKVSLTAKPLAGQTFLRWEDGSQAVARSLVMPNTNVTVAARFGLTTNVPPPVIADPGALRATVGVTFTQRLDIASESLPTVSVAGLPAGLKYDAATRSVTGVPTAAVSNKTVTVTAKNVNPAARTQTFSLTVEPLPLWAWGEFNGVLDEERLGFGTGFMSVSGLGKISGKVSVAGTNYSFSAAAYARRDDDPAFWFAGQAVAGRVSLPLRLRVALPDSVGDLGVVTQTLSVADGWLGDTFDNWPALTLYRKVWKDAGVASSVTNYTGYFTATLPGDGTYGSGYLAFTVDSAGSVKTAGKLADGTAVSLSGALILDEAGRVWTVLHTAPAAYRGGSFFGRAEFAVPEAEGPLCVRLLDEVWMTWENRSLLATEAYGEGFLRDVGLSGGKYDKVINLRAYYTNDLAVGGVDELPTLQAAVKLTDWNDAETAKVTAYEAVEVDAAPASPAGLPVSVTPLTGLGTALAAPKAQTPAWDPDAEAYNYADLVNPSAFAIAFTRATGLFKGSFNVWYDYVSAEDYTTDRQTLTHVAKKVSYEGVLTPARANPDDGVEGAGFFLWAKTALYLNALQREVTYSFTGSYDLLLLSD